MAFGRGYGFNYGLGGAAYVPPAPPPVVVPTTIATPSSAWVGDLVSFGAAGVYSGDRDENFTSGDIRVDSMIGSPPHPYWVTYSINPAYQSGNGVVLRPTITSDCLLTRGETFNYGDVSIGFEIQGRVSSGKPSGDVTYAGLLLTSASGNINVQRKYHSATGRHQYIANILHMGANIAVGALNTTSLYGEIRVAWCRSSVHVLVRDSKLAPWKVLLQTDTLPSTFANCNVTIFSSNSVIDPAITKLYWFKSVPGVLLGSILAIDTYVTANDVAAIIPAQPSKNIKSVDMCVFYHNGERGTGTFTYEINRTLRLNTTSAGRTDLV